MGQRPPAPCLSRRSMHPWQKQRQPSTHRMRRPAQHPHRSQPSLWMWQLLRGVRQRHTSTSRGPVQLLQMMCMIILSCGGTSSSSSRVSTACRDPGKEHH